MFIIVTIELTTVENFGNYLVITFTRQEMCRPLTGNDICGRDKLKRNAILTKLRRLLFYCGSWSDEDHDVQYDTEDTQDQIVNQNDVNVRQIIDGTILDIFKTSRKRTGYNQISDNEDDG